MEKIKTIAIERCPPPTLISILHFKNTQKRPVFLDQKKPSSFGKKKGSHKGGGWGRGDGYVALSSSKLQTALTRVPAQLKRNQKNFRQHDDHDYPLIIHFLETHADLTLCFGQLLVFWNLFYAYYAKDGCDDNVY